MKISKLTGFLYLFILLADVAALFFEHPHGLHYRLKPLLMPVLLLFLLQNSTKNNIGYWGYIAMGIIFAWVGDVFLLFEPRNPAFFLAGLASFLVTHLSYILFFKKLSPSNKGWWKRNLFVWITVLVYGLLLTIGLWPSLGSMKIPVIIYASCISIMVMLGLSIQPSLPKHIWVWMAIGAFLFLISDSILALNKFYKPIYFAPPLIMLTYGLAQLFIVFGTIRLCLANGHVDAKPAVL